MGNSTHQKVKTGRQLQGKELLAARRRGNLTIGLTFKGEEGYERAVTIDDVWEDRETFMSYITGLGGQVFDALEHHSSKRR